MESEPPRPSGHVSALINPHPTVDQICLDPQHKLPPSSHTQQNTLPHRTKSCLRPPPQDSFWNSPKNQLQSTHNIHNHAVKYPVYMLFLEECSLNQGWTTHSHIHTPCQTPWRAYSPTSTSAENYSNKLSQHPLRAMVWPGIKLSAAVCYWSTQKPSVSYQVSTYSWIERVHVWAKSAEHLSTIQHSRRSNQLRSFA